MPTEKFTYTVREESVDGVVRYFAAFVDGSGLPQEAEIPREVYLALDQCRLAEKKQQNETERHMERLELSEGQLAARALRPQKPMEEAVAEAVDMQAAIATLTDAQRRRFLLYHEHGLNYEQIAQAENLSKQAIAQSIARAEEVLKKFFEDGVDKRGAE
jgi:DNA-directed RNA polymerase specialized sigma24 family protein